MTTIIFAVLTVFLLYRFLTLLGKHDTPPQAQPSSSTPPKPTSRLDKLDLLLRRHKVPTFLKPTFSEIFLKSPQFDLGRFLKNASSAHELILSHAFAGTLSKIDDLLSTDAKASLLNHNSHEGTKVRIRTKTAELVNAEFKNPTALLSLQFTTEATTPHEKLELLEEWTFSKDLSTNDPTWVLASVTQR